MEALGLLMHGFAVLLTWKTIALMMVGLVLGIFVGVLPGLGGPNGVAILLPLTFTMDPTSAIVMLSCIYWGALFGGASLYGLVTAFLSRTEATETFVTRAQLRRVMAVFVPTLLFCLAMQFLGLYVASFLLISIFMRLVGKIAVWKSLLTAFVFTAVMFVTFDIAFDVIMPKGPLEAALGR